MSDDCQQISSRNVCENYSMGTWESVQANFPNIWSFQIAEDLLAIFRAWICLAFCIEALYV